MKINFTKQEYRSLVELLELASWVVYGPHANIPESIKHYHTLIQRLYSHAKEMDMEDCVEFSKEHQEYFITGQIEEDTILPLIDEYIEDVFWNELEARLARRDAQREFGEAKLNKMSLEDRVYAIHPHEEKWGDEFEEHGLERLGIVQKLH